IGATELYRLRDRLLPLVRLGRVLKLEDSAPQELGIANDAKRERAKGLYIAVLDPEGRRFGLVLDGLRPPEEIVVKPLPPTLREIDVYAGTTVLGNGALAMILDAAAIGDRAGLSSAEEDRRAGVAGAVAYASEETAGIDVESIAMESAMVVYE